MDPQVPAVVAVVVTSGPRTWLDDTLSSLAAQDYAELSVLVLATGEDEDLAERVGRILPNAFVRQLPGRPGYAAAANEVLGMVEGAAFFLFCHDDVSLDADAVPRLVEESFRSNAGVVSPKFVNWDDPSILLHVGMSCDKTGAVIDRIVPGEVDHGQHDAVRDVFVAPGGCLLVRSDLFSELKGFDAGIVAMGEDLDLSWRCQVAGSRVVVAPDARVRHREAVAGGTEPLAIVVETNGKRPVTMQALQRRHELRAVLKCYTRLTLLRVLPQAALLAIGEVVIAVLARDRERARAVIGAWRWNARHLTELSLLRGELAEHRLFPDAEVRRLQVRGSARLSRYLSRLSYQGLEAANAVTSGRERPAEDERSEVAVLTGSVGTAFSEDADFDELDDLGRRAGRDRFGRRVRRPPLGTGRQRALAIVVSLVVIAVGTRDLFFGTLPLVGQLAPLPSWTTTWHHFVSGWQSAGVGTTAPASPAFGIAGIAGTVLFGAMGTLQRVLLLGCIPLGAWGVSRFMRPLVSPRARIIAVICYLGLPLPYGALGTGRWDGLVAYAAFPFIALRLAARRCRGTLRRCTVGALAQQAGGAGRRAWRHHRCRRRVRTCDRPGRPAPRRGVGTRFRDHGRTGHALASPPRGRRSGGCGAPPHASLGGRHSAGREGLGGDLRPAPRWRDLAGLGRRAPIRRRPCRPVAPGLASRRGGGVAIAPGPGPSACLGDPPVGHGARVMGPGVRRLSRRHGLLRPVGDRRVGAGGLRGRRVRRIGDLRVRERSV